LEVLSGRFHWSPYLGYGVEPLRGKARQTLGLHPRFS
jgi:hypothetical protein